MHKLHTFVNLPWGEKMLALRLLVLLPKSRWAVKRVPFKEVAARMGTLGDGAITEVSSKGLETAKRMGILTKSMSAWMPFRTLCFEQALSCAALLRRKKIAHCIHFGVKKHHSDAQRLEAHAWLQCGNAIVTGRKGHREFKRVSSFYYLPEEELLDVSSKTTT